MLSGKFPYGVQVARCTNKAAQKKLKYASLDSDENNIPIWIDEALKKALKVDPYDRYAELSEFLFDLRHPNMDFVNKARAPLIERHPVVLWKGISLVLVLIIVLLLSR